jgi:predicted phosphodiesterase
VESLANRVTTAFFGLLVVLGASACHDSGSLRPSPEVRSLTVSTVSAGTLTLPNRPTSVKFAVIGDSGRGTRQQHDVATQMSAFRDQFRFAFVLMLGDNIYEGPAAPEDYLRKFEKPYDGLLDDGVKFYAVLGNHDDPDQVNYPLFNMRGERYYSFAPPEDLLAKIVTRVEFFAIDSTNLDRTQLDWLEERLAASKTDWKICFFHHPLYTSGRYRSSSRLHRLILEPVLVEHDVDVAFSGHEHMYQRTVLQQGIQYFVSGAAGSLRMGDGAPSPNIARTFDRDYHFMLIEIDGDELHFQAISRTGQTIDAGTLYQDGRDAGASETGAARQRDTRVLR